MIASTDASAIRLLLDAACSLRAATADSGPLGVGYRQSSEGLAALIEAWCVDHSDRLAPELTASLSAGERESDASMLKALRHSLANEAPTK